MDESNYFGVSTGKTSRIVRGTFPLSHLRTRDDLVHHIRIVDKTNKLLRYVLRHDQREYLVTLAMVEVLPEAHVTCLICVEKGPERAVSDDEENIQGISG